MVVVTRLLGLVGLMLVVDAADAGAAAEPYALAYRAVAGCPDEATLRADVAAHVQDKDRASGVRIDVAIRTAAQGFGGSIVIVDRWGNEDRRELGGADCGELAHALAFLAGVAVDLGARSPQPAAASVATSAAPAPPVSAPRGVARDRVRRARHGRAPRRRRRWPEARGRCRDHR